MRDSIRKVFVRLSKTQKIVIILFFLLGISLPLIVAELQKPQDIRQQASTIELDSFPKPQFDTGIGIHWSADVGYAYDNETGERSVCLLKDIGVSWIKINAEGLSGLDFARVMKANDIEPIVRLYRHQPLPNTLPASDLNAITDYVNVGVSYFESTNEPNISHEWQNNVMPNCQEAVVKTMAAWVQDARNIQEKGGYPLFPGLSPGGTCDDITFLQNSFEWLKTHPCSLANNTAGSCLGLFDATKSNGKPAVMSIHNYNINHDNRKDDNNNIIWYTDDSNAFLKLTAYNNIIISYLGRSIPILAGEDGMIMDDSQDPRFPKTDASWHKDVTVAMAQYQMDNKTPYFFNTAFWLAMPNRNKLWKNAGWFTLNLEPRYTETITTLQQLPKTSRNGTPEPSSCTLVKAPPPTCGSSCTQCILNARPDILPFYQDSGWNISCGNRDAIVTNWCGVDSSACTTLKTTTCRNACATTTPTVTPSPTLSISPTLTPSVTSTLTPTPLIGDFNKNGTVDEDDYKLWKEKFVPKTYDSNIDANNNGTIDIGDFNIWRENK